MKNDMCECKCKRENQIIFWTAHSYHLYMCLYTDFVNPSKLRERTIDQIEQLQRQHDEVSSLFFALEMKRKKQASKQTNRNKTKRGEYWRIFTGMNQNTIYYINVYLISNSISYSYEIVMCMVSMLILRLLRVCASARSNTIYTHSFYIWIHLGLQIDVHKLFESCFHYFSLCVCVSFSSASCHIDEVGVYLLVAWFTHLLIHSFVLFGLARFDIVIHLACFSLPSPPLVWACLDSVLISFGAKKSIKNYLV